MKFKDSRKARFLLCVMTACAGHAQQSATVAAVPNATSSVTTPGGVTGALPVFNGTSSIAGSRLYYTNGQLGIGKSPDTALDVAGESHFAGAGLFLPFRTATASRGSSSHSLRLQTSVFNSSTNAAVQPFMQFSAEPEGNNTASPSASLHLLYNGGSGSAVESGLYFNSNGTIHFAPAQTFPIAAGPAGPTGPTGPAGPQGPQGAPGASGSLTLPYSGFGSSNGPIFSVENQSPGDGIYVTAGESGDGLSIRAGSSGDDQGRGGDGILVYAGQGPHGGFGGSDPGGTAIRAYGGYGDLGGGNGIEAYAGDGNGNFGPQGIGIIAHGGRQDPPPDDPRAVVSPIAGLFYGDVQIDGNLSKSGGSFKIDDPLDPSNKYLYHSFVESPDMKNIYDGNVTTNGSGEAVVTMPDYFEALNRDFRYQLTVIGQFAQAIVATKIANNVFTIRTDKPNVEVSWMVTGVRQDAWANAHRIPIEQEKVGREKGHYLHPELFGQPEETRIMPAGVVAPKSRPKQK